MIKNVVFDFGQVMVHFDPAYMVGKYVTNQQDSALLTEVLFDRLYWDRLDEGTLTDEALLEACRTRLPERLWDVSEQIYYNWIYNIPEIEGMRELAEWVRFEKEKHVFLLSNISVYFTDHAQEIPCLAIFEKCIFSAKCGKVKPNRDIFEYLCAECGISPAETVFVDDNPKNIKGAEDAGISGCLFDGDANNLRHYLESIF